MNVTVLVPSEEYRTYAGARIRYGRLVPHLAAQGIALSLVDIAKFEPTADQSDIVLLSKCHDARALVAAAAMSERGKLVGVDLFDDYFSEREDSRLTRFRSWLSQLLPSCDFALCSTRSMADVVSDYDRAVATHVVNDPAPTLDIESLSKILPAKLRAARNGDKLQIAWFGVGDNPHFRVGLSDVAAFAGALRPLTHQFEVGLTVLTNARALHAEGLELLARLPVFTEIHEWSEEAEGELLARSFACYLPVNAQPFSAVKSLNRAVTALTAGCQVISAGYPLYAELGDFIYREPTDFLRDLTNRAMKHSALNLPRFSQVIAESASAPREAGALAEFLRARVRPESRERRAVALVQGHSANGTAHKWAKSFRWLSVASPYCATGLEFDVIFKGSIRGLSMYVSDRAKERLRPDMRQQLEKSTMITDRKFWLVPSCDDDTACSANAEQDWHSAPLPFQIATYGATIRRIGERMDEAFGPCRVLLSENSQLPFSPEL